MKGFSFSKTADKRLCKEIYVTVILFFEIIVSENQAKTSKDTTKGFSFIKVTG